MIKRIKPLFMLTLVLLTALALASCQFQPPGGGLPQAGAVTDRIRTQAVSTALAQLTLQAVSAGAATVVPTASATPTMEPSPTSPPPTAAPSVTPTAALTQPTAAAAAPARPTFTATPAQTDYVCAVEEIEPAAGVTVSVGADFDFVVRLKNTGAKDWLPGRILFMYTSGQKMQAKAGLVPLTSKVVIDAEVNFTLDMRAPDAPGTYLTTWALYQAPLFYCPVHFKIVVTK